MGSVLALLHRHLRDKTADAKSARASTEMNTKPQATNANANANSEIAREFVWKGAAKEVRVAGSFNNWTPSVLLSRSNGGDSCIHSVSFRVPKQAVQFKFVVDGEWKCSLDYPTCLDSNGNTNNVLV
jgi:1,4-alpha-glucan branching enzyme